VGDVVEEAILITVVIANTLEIAGLLYLWRNCRGLQQAQKIENLYHDVITPVAAIFGLVRSLEAGAAEGDGLPLDTRKKIYQAIEEQFSKLSSIDPRLPK
jgi:hypothetical protein